MTEGGTGRNPGIAKGIGGLSVIMGGVWVVGALWPLVRVISGAKELENGWFMFVMVPLLAVPGALAVLAGFLLFREVSLPHLKAVVGLFAALGGLWVHTRLADRFPDLWNERIDIGVFFLIGIVTGVLFYLLAMRWLVPALGLEWAGFRRVLNKGVFLLIAYQLWMVLFSIGEVVVHDLEIGVGGDLLVLFVPILIAWVFFKAAVRWLASGQPVPTNPAP